MDNYIHCEIYVKKSKKNRKNISYTQVYQQNVNNFSLKTSYQQRKFIISNYLWKINRNEKISTGWRYKKNVDIFVGYLVPQNGG